PTRLRSVDDKALWHGVVYRSASGLRPVGLVAYSSELSAEKSAPKTERRCCEMARLVTARQAAEELGVVERTVRRWIVAGEVAAQKERGAFVIDLDAAREVHRRSRAGRTVERSTEVAELR